jgi:hypothetical protein
MRQVAEANWIAAVRERIAAPVKNHCIAELSGGCFTLRRRVSSPSRGSLRNLQFGRLSCGIAQCDAHFLDLQVKRRELRGCAGPVALVPLRDRPIQSGEGDRKVSQLKARRSRRRLRRCGGPRVLSLEPGGQQVCIEAGWLHRPLHHGRGIAVGGFQF